MRLSPDLLGSQHITSHLCIHHSPLYSVGSSLPRRIPRRAPHAVPLPSIFESIYAVVGEIELESRSNGFHLGRVLGVLTYVELRPRVSTSDADSFTAPCARAPRRVTEEGTMCGVQLSSSGITEQFTDDRQPRAGRLMRRLITPRLQPTPLVFLHSRRRPHTHRCTPTTTSRSFKDVSVPRQEHGPATRRATRPGRHTAQPLAGGLVSMQCVLSSRRASQGD